MSKTQRKEAKSTKSGRERENPHRLEPLPSFSLPSRCPCPDGALVLPLHCSIWKPSHNRDAITMTKTHQEPMKKNKKKKNEQKNQEKRVEI